MTSVVEAPTKQNYIGDMDMTESEAARLGSPQLTRIYKSAGEAQACILKDCSSDCGKDCDGSCTYVDSSPSPCRRCDSDCGSRDRSCDICNDWHCNFHD